VLASFVAEARRKVTKKVELLKGRYRFEWGGQFENYERARDRLLIVVPVAVALIFVLLFFTYHNVVDALRVTYTVGSTTRGTQRPRSSRHRSNSPRGGTTPASARLLPQARTSGTRSIWPAG
jgi:hypothetical protein